MPQLLDSSTWHQQQLIYSWQPFSRYTHKTSSYWTSSYKMSSYKTSIYQMSSYKTSRLQNVLIAKRPYYQTSRLPNVQLPNVQLQNVHTSNYYKTSSFFLFSNTDNFGTYETMMKKRKTKKKLSLATFRIVRMNPVLVVVSVHKQGCPLPAENKRCRKIRVIFC